jgi:hypothetical protein
MKLKSAVGILSVVMMLAGCATIPPGPSVMVLPGSGKTFDSFQADDSVCRQWAQNQTGWNANKTVNEDLAGGTIGGGALGAAAGALIGSASGNLGAGAAIGAGAGLLGGAALGSTQGYGAGAEVQRRYDNAYQECMYAKGNQIPGHMQVSNRGMSPPPPPPPNYAPGLAPVPPPPRGNPPPAPPSS